MSRSTSASAISPLLRAIISSSGRPAARQRSGSAVHSSGKDSRSPTGTGTSCPARVSETIA
jgi:proline racemase